MQLRHCSAVARCQQLLHLQVRPGQVTEHDGRLLQITKFQHAHGSGRQLGNVQVWLVH